MIFSSYHFLFIFLPVVFTLYFALCHFKFLWAARWLLVFSSLYFYWCASQSFFPFFIGGIVLNFAIGAVLSNRILLPSWAGRINRKLILIAGLSWHIGLLIHFKYRGFFLENLHSFGKSDVLLKVAIPVGISFLTFQQISYLVDSYRQQTREYSFLTYALYITFFPQLIVGPIVYHRDVVPQYSDDERMRLHASNIALGLFIFSIGLAKKVMLADPMTNFAQTQYLDVAGMTTVTAWLATLAYNFSYYFDLSGYTDMAIGLGWLFNIKLPANFDSPFKARNFSDYWKRNHMTLSRFLGDYITWPLILSKHGGSRWFKSAAAKFYYATMVTFLVSGFWHGAGWNFVIWGILNGLFVCSAYWMMRAKINIPYFLAWFMTFVGLNLTRVIFVSKSLKDSEVVFRKIFDLAHLDFLYAINFYSEPIAYVVIASGIAFFLPNSGRMAEKFKPNLGYLIFTSMLIFMCLLNMEKAQVFLYFQF